MLTMIVFIMVGYQVGDLFAGSTPNPLAYRPWYALVLAAGALGLLLGPYVTLQPVQWLWRRIHAAPASALAAGTIGLIAGLLIAVLLAWPLSMLPEPLGRWLPLVAAGLLGYTGMTVMILRRQEMPSALSTYLPLSVTGRMLPPGGALPVVVDTSCIIDGRIADVAATGFIQGTLVVPQFVLDELRHIADAADATRRIRGRRGLEVLNRLQREKLVSTEISDVDFDDVAEVDAKLVRLAKQLGGAIITNDYNLNRVAEFQGVKVLNVNELANAVKSVVLPGEELRVRVIQEGKEANQGVAFLDDGTMVVVDNGRRLVGNEVSVTVTRALQTAAGRMIFAAPRSDTAA